MRKTHGIPRAIAEKASIRLFPDDERTGPQQLRRHGISSVFYHLGMPPGEEWPVDEIMQAKRWLESNGMQWSVVESMMLHPEQLYGGKRREELNDNCARTIENLAKCEITRIMINLMGPVDWLRTNFRFRLESGALTSCYDRTKLQGIKDQAGPDGFIQLPAWPRRVHISELEGDRATPEEVRRNVRDLFEHILPVADAAGAIIEVHPDDPNEEVFGYPRIVTCPEDYEKLFAMDHTSRRSLKVAFCAGALAQSVNNLPEYLTQLAQEERLGDVHIRDILKTPTGFLEVRHGEGQVDIPGIVQAMLDTKAALESFWRPDHAVQTEPADDCLPGYEFRGRIEALYEILGMFVMANRLHSNQK